MLYYVLHTYSVCIHTQIYPFMSDQRMLCLQFTYVCRNTWFAMFIPIIYSPPATLVCNIPPPQKTSAINIKLNYCLIFQLLSDWLLDFKVHGANWSIAIISSRVEYLVISILNKTSVNINQNLLVIFLCVSRLQLLLLLGLGFWWAIYRVFILTFHNVSSVTSGSQDRSQNVWNFWKKKKRP